MRVYLAADSSQQKVMQELRELLRTRKIGCTSRWLDVDLMANKGQPYTEVELAEWAQKDLEDVESAHVLIAFNPESHHKQGTGGRHVELGYAIAKKIPIIYVGEKRENIFHYHPSIAAVLNHGAYTTPEFFADALAFTIADIQP